MPAFSLSLIQAPSAGHIDPDLPQHQQALVVMQLVLLKGKLTQDQARLASDQSHQVLKRHRTVRISDLGRAVGKDNQAATAANVGVASAHGRGHDVGDRVARAQLEDAVRRREGWRGVRVRGPLHALHASDVVALGEAFAQCSTQFQLGSGVLLQGQQCADSNLRLVVSAHVQLWASRNYQHLS